MAKAYKIVSRMSEDIDFKIQIKDNARHLTKTRLLKELKIFRSYLKSQLLISGLVTHEPIVRNEGQYSKIEITYSTIFSIHPGLRPHILLEFTLSNTSLSIQQLQIRTLIEDTLNTTLFNPSLTQCISIEETAIEKWVGLTCRISAIERGYQNDDPTIIRHVYDLNSIQLAIKLNENSFILAKKIIHNDTKQFKNQHPEYFANPANEIKQSIYLLKNKFLWKNRYQEFIDAMVYGDDSPVGYEQSINDLENLSTKILKVI